MSIPKYYEMYNALLKALHELGGSAAVSEMEDKVAENLQLTEEQINEIHRGNRTKFSYRLAWAINYLKRYGLLENSSRGVWALTKKGLETFEVDEQEVNSYVKNLDRQSSSQTESLNEEEPDMVEDWKTLLSEKLLEMGPNAFERLCQRILRESGFVEVEIIGKSGDGGIDGKGILRLNGLVGFRIVFQCKRYRGTVSSKVIRDFRGATHGRADRGLLITTGKFSRDAIREASREGAFPIDLIDGDMLIEKMKELGLGVNSIPKTEITVNEKWFDKV